MAYGYGTKGSPIGTALLALLLLALAVLGSAAPASAGADDLAIKVLSNRADLISGGDALVEVVIPADVNPDNVRVALDGKDVTSAFAVRANGRFMGLVDLPLDPTNEVNPHELTAYVTSAPTAKPPARITIVDHAFGGPVVAGAQLQPWICAYRVVTPVPVTVPGTTLSATVNSRASGLGSDPLDGKCNAVPTFTYFYQPKERQGTSCVFNITGTNRCFEPYDFANPPADAAIADFTNDRGDTAKSIIVVERGAINRGMYQIISFNDPRVSNAPWDPQKGWNGKLLWRFGASAAVSRFQTPTSNATAAINPAALQRGFMIAASSLTDHGTNSNDTLGAETMMMVKELIAENYGPIRYTIGEGCSGGSIMQHSIAAQYPGLLNGIQPNCSYPDTFSTFIEIADCGNLQNRYYATPNGSALTAVQRAAINGHALTTGSTGGGFCNAWITSFLPAGNPSVGGNCGFNAAATSSLVYDKAARPDGIRCAGGDHAVAIFGSSVDPDGIKRANSPNDNEGVQYGLKALVAGVINAEEFVRLNEGVGSYDGDLAWSGSPPATLPYARRRASNTALDAVYKGSIVSDGRQLAKVPIIDLRGNQAANGDIHMNWRAWAVRDRLDRDFGDHGNQLIWAYSGNGGAGTPGAALALRSFITMDAWLASIEQDTSSASIEAKVRSKKPAGAADFCLATTGATDADLAAAVPLDSAACPVKFQSSPRQVAGGPLAENIFKCQLKALDFASADYGAVTFNDDQKARLAAVFPTGVCDWSKPGVGQVASFGGTNWGSGAGSVGGVPQPLGDAPTSGFAPALLTALGPANVWVGLKNSDDVGTNFDLEAKVYKNGDATPIGSGQLRRVPGGGAGFGKAVLDSIALALADGPVEVPSGTVLRVHLGARITCSGKTHSSGAVRLWLNDAQAASGFGTTVDGVSGNYYLRSGGGLGATQGAGPKTTVDVSLNSKQKCSSDPELDRPFTSLGDWSITLP